VCRYNWHSAGSGWPFPMLKCKYVFRIKYSEEILSDSTRKLLRFEITRMLIAVFKNKLIVLFIVIFGTLSQADACDGAGVCQAVSSQEARTDSHVHLSARRPTLPAF